MGKTLDRQPRDDANVLNMAGATDKKASGLADSLYEEKRALTVPDVAELLNISERQVYKLVAEYRIPSFKIGGSIRFDPFAIAVWLREKMALAKPCSR